MSEFDLIQEYFSSIGNDAAIDHEAFLKQGIGDDAAIVESNELLAISIDTFIEGVHFPAITSAYDIGWKALAVNLSDMAAMGAKPTWFTLAITLPEISSDWLKSFSKGLSDIAQSYSVPLIGGDTTRGNLSITIQIAGHVHASNQLLRSNARPNDLIYVTEYIGDAALGLESLDKKLNLSSTEINEVRLALNRPKPRVKEMLALRDLCHAAIDISDGLLADLGHILTASNVGADVDVNALPISREYRWCCQGPQSYDLALTGGDDYEICMTVPVENEKNFLTTCENLNLKVSKIGIITETGGLSLLRNNQPYEIMNKSYDHFS